MHFVALFSAASVSIPPVIGSASIYGQANASAVASLAPLEHNHEIRAGFWIACCSAWESFFRLCGQRSQVSRLGLTTTAANQQRSPRALPTSCDGLAELG